MRHILTAAAVAATLTFSIGAAEAFPIAPMSGVAASPEVTLVSGGCGPYRHRGPFGNCRPNFGGPGFYGRPHRFGYGYGYGFHRFHPFYHRHFY